MSRINGAAARVNSSPVFAELSLTVSPAIADTINGVIVSGIEGVQFGAPYAALASGAMALGVMAHDSLRKHGTLTRLAARDAFESVRSRRQPRKSRLGRILAGTAVAALASVPTAASVGGAAFVLGTEESIRTDQLNSVQKMFEEAGVDDDDLLVTQGGADTPMATSDVPRELAGELRGAGFYVRLPKVGDGNDRTMDGLMMSVPSMAGDEVIVSGLTGLREGDEIHIAGVNVGVTSAVDRQIGSMQRETVLVSNGVAEEVMGYENEEGSYFGVYLPSADHSQESVQADLDERYGEGRYSVLTAAEFKEGVEGFMGKNGSPILLLAAIAMSVSGVVTESAAAYRRTTLHKKNIGTLKALGASNYDAAAPEILSTYYRLLASAPVAAAIGYICAVGANSINLGLNSTVGPREAIGALVVVGVPSLTAATVATRKIVKGIPPAEAARA